MSPPFLRFFHLWDKSGSGLAGHKLFWASGKSNCIEDPIIKLVRRHWTNVYFSIV